MTDAELSRDLERVRKLAHALDSAIGIPGTRVRLGADALLGLLPGAGDAVSAALAAYPVVIAVRHRLPTALVLRLMGNIAFDALAGTVPVIGDLFDVGFKANVRNHALIERYAAQPAHTVRASRALFWVAIGGMTLLIGGLVAGSMWLVISALGAITR
ncbi:MAG: DUF4112 domain-containing protein [Gemmatimonadaceae bacterium]